jgi:hypothetical protein
MSYQYRFSNGPYASHAYILVNSIQIFTFQLDFGCGDETYFDIYYDNKWSSIKNISELTNDIVKELFLLAAEHTIIKLKGYSERSDKALADLKALLEN